MMGKRQCLTIQPVIPVSLNEDWNVISRTILPVIWQNDIAGPSGEQSGLGDITQSLFFSPKNPGPSGIVWGVGPVFLAPTATDDLLGGGKWGAGPTAVVLKQHGGWTFGALGNHIRRWRPLGHQFHLPAAFHFIHDQGRLDLRRQHGKHLQLGNGRLVGSDQFHDRQAGQVRQATGQFHRRRPLLGRKSRQRPGRSWVPRCGDIPVSEMTAR